MDEDTQHEITLACIALLQKNAADGQQARKRNVLYEKIYASLWSILRNVGKKTAQ